MKIINFFEAENKEYWISKIKESDWSAGELLANLIIKGEIEAFIGENSKILLLVKDDELIAYTTYAQKDDIKPTDITPWIGFVYTFPQYRGNHYAGKIIEYAEELARKDGFEATHISTGHIGLYEKYGYEFWKTMRNVNGGDSRVYIKKLI